MKPPPLARRLALLLLPVRDRQAVADELDELYQLRLERHGLPKARRWYWRQAAVFPVLRLGSLLRSRDPFKPARQGRPRPKEKLMNSIAQEIGWAMRSLSKSPGLVCVVVLTLALAIGANTAIFSLLNSALLQPLPYRDPSELVRIYSDSPPYRWPFSVADFLALEEQQTSFSAVAALTRQGMTLSGRGPAERLQAQRVTAEYFSLLGLEAQRGRVFQSGDDRPQAPLTVVLSHQFWQSRLGGDRDVVGKILRLDGLPHTIIGVLPALAGPLQTDVDLWPVFPLEAPPRKGPFFFTVLGRLKPETTPAEAIEELRAINKRIFPIWQESYQDSRTSWSLEPLSAFVTGQSGGTLSVLLAAVGFVLLVACANIANLMLVRASSRRSELALRTALGASGGRLLRLFLTESLLLSAAGGLMGLLLGGWLLRAIQSADVAGLPRIGEASLSWAVLGFTAAVATLCGLLFGSLPALQFKRTDLAVELRSGGNQSSSRPSQARLRSSLVALEVALALPLLIGAGLMSNSLMRLAQVDPGFDVRNLLTMNLFLPPSFLNGPEDALAFWDEALPRISSLPGVEGATLSSSLPPDRARELNNFDLEAHPTPPGESQPVAPYMAVRPNYFDTLGIPLLEGRLIEPSDRRDTPQVAVVARAWAERFFPGQSPVGQRFKSGGCAGCPWTTIVGVVADVKYTGLQNEEGAIYTPHEQVIYRGMYLTLRTSQPALQLEQPVRQVIASLAPDLAPSEVRSMEDRLSGSLARPRQLTALVGSFAALALLLVLIGIYGVLSWFVNQERKQIGIRMALGGSQGRLFWSVVSRGMRWAVSGLAAGILVALLLSRFLDSLLFEVVSTDGLTYAAVTAALAAVAMLACSIPARRAVRLDPVQVLKAE